MTADTENQQYHDASTGTLSPMTNSRDDQVERYLLTGEHDALFCAWPGTNLLARARQGDVALRGALVSMVKSSAAHLTVPKQLADLDVVSFTRAKMEPMVRGLFAGPEQQAVLDALARSVVFLTPATIEPLLTKRDISRRLGTCQTSTWRAATQSYWPAMRPGLLV
jgi:hypothetical protein